jgi:hypothetical protein
MTGYVAPSIHGVRMVSVGDTETYGVPLDADVIVRDSFTLICTREGSVHRLISRDGDVVEAPLNNAQRAHALQLCGR